MRVTAGITVDPVLAPWERRLLRAGDRTLRKLTRIAVAIGPVPDRILVGYLAAAGAAASAEMMLPGSRWAWAWFLGCAAAAGLLAAAGAAGAARRYRAAYVRPEDLDRGSLYLLARAQAAVSGALAARVRLAGYLDVPSSAAVLAAREWEIACMLRRLSAVSAGGMPADGREIVRDVTASVIRRVEELELYAERVQAADAAYRDGPGPGQDLLDLAAATASDSQASGEIAGLTRDADAAGQYFAGPDAIMSTLHARAVDVRVNHRPGS